MNGRVIAGAMLVLGACISYADPVEFSIEPPDQTMRGVVVVLDWTQSPGSSLHAVLDGRTRVPATMREGRVHFVVPSIDAGDSVSGHIVSVDTPIAEPHVVVASDEALHRLTVRLEDELLTRYWHDPQNRKPYLWPMNTVGEVGITRDWPMGERVKTIDHEHHQSVWTAYGDVNGADYWEYNERTGWQQTESLDWGSGDAFGWIRATNVWVDADREPVIREHREYRFYNGDAEHRLVDIDVTLIAGYGAVRFEDTKEGGFIALRIRDELRERSGSGTITNSEGGLGSKECWGKPAAWLDYSGPLEDHGVRGVAVFDHPTSFRHPTYWHARDYGLVGANPFGLSDFTDGRLNGDYTLPAGESITFRYRLLLHTGDVKKANVAEYYAGFANPPPARWTSATP